MEIVRAAQTPAIGDLTGLFAWVRPDDTLLVDADAGLLRVNPPATTIASAETPRNRCPCSESFGRLRDARCTSPSVMRPMTIFAYTLLLGYSLLTKILADFLSGNYLLN